MKKSYALISDVRNENIDLTRRLYKTIIDVVRQLDKQRSEIETCSDLFTPQVEILRSKLRECCERLIFCDPTSYGRKAEEILWRKGFYDVVSAAKRLRDGGPWSTNEEAYLCLHITCGLGFYHHLLLRLQSDFHLQYAGLVDFPLLTADQAKTTPSAKSIKWAEESAQRCLVCLGDLCRYTLELHLNSLTSSPSLASRYYYQAIRLNPDVGMPHNQLGTLSGSTNFGIDAVYHFMRCILCSQPFEGADGNMSRAIDNALRKSSDKCNGEVESPLSVFCNFSKQLLYSAEAWFWGNSPQIVNENIVQDLEKGVQVGVVGCDALVKVVGILLMCHERQKQKPMKLFSACAVIVTLLKCMVQQALEGLPLSPLSINGKCDAKRLTRRQKQHHRRRRRRCAGDSSDDSELSESGDAVLSDNSASDISDVDDEDVAASSSDSSDAELREDGGGDNVKVIPAVGEESDRKKAIECGSGDGLENQRERALAVLSPIKICVEWLSCYPDIARSLCTDDLKADIEKLADRLDAMTLAAPVPCNGSPVPLPEDVQLQGLRVLAGVHEALDWSAWTRIRLVGDSETIVRAARVSAACREVVTALAKAPTPDVVTQVNGVGNGSSNRNVKGRSKGQLMHSMGQLWLRAEVRALESRVGRNNGAETLSPYLVVDADALTGYAVLIRQLVSARRFILLIPTAVLSALDRLKRESARAREAIRWLEEQLHRGSRFLRAQRVGESLPLPLKYPRRKERDGWLFFQVMECCHYLSQRGGSEASMVTLLTGTAVGIPGAPAPSAQFSPVGVAKSIGVNLEHVEAFFSKWKNSSKSHG